MKFIKPKKSLNKAFLKVKPFRQEIETFKSELITLLNRINEAESEEFHKNLVSDFLKKTYYDSSHFINTKGRNDLVIHNGKTAKTSVGVILETKKPTNRAEMISKENINAKAFQELILYYLRERITFNNLEVKHLIVTNIYEWYIFDATLFDRLFAQNKKLVQQFKDFEAGRLAGIKTDFFYSEIARPFIENISEEIEFTYFDIRDYEKPLRNADLKDDNKLIALFKLLSPEHLLKLPFANDSNNLDKTFYAELLHIIGLTETKKGGKKVIERNPKNKRNSASILENAIVQLDTRDKINRLDRPSQYGENYEERLFNVALQLSITWINRILFLKLLEAQLQVYHDGNPDYQFLNLKKIADYDDLDSLFFQVLAKKYEERIADVKQIFSKVPYLNSSLFEPTEMEHDTIFISNLQDDRMLPILSQTVLKDSNGKRRSGELSTLEYLFEFLNAYDFSSEGSEAIQEDNKSLINASVLGLIFEKINGYKDGSFFTPGFITMYMCRETIRKAVVQKFNETKNWNCETLDDVYDKIDDRNEANAIVNSIKICDPAVGSGHFLVSALNEMIAIKNDLRILQDREGKRLKEYHVEVVNDELIITDEDGGLYEYRPNSKESQRVQKALFHEKQTIIENCLFGVDINPNSVKICRLRLWIELLKNAYYTNPDAEQPALETLPNIDINIKTGNSLISRFDLDADLRKALRDSKWTIDGYRNAVATYRNAENKEQKRQMEQLISDIKNDFRSEISANDPKVKRLYKLNGELFNLTQQQSLFDMSQKEKTAWNKKVEKLTQDVKKLEAEIEEIKNNKIFKNAFEWRFEFPEVLNEDGEFVGFDVVIGNPPYIQLQKMGQESVELGRMGFETYERTGDIFSLFYELGFNVLKKNGVMIYITSNKWMRAGYGKSTRRFFADKTNPLILIDFGGIQIFDSATVDTNILMFSKSENKGETLACVIRDKEIQDLDAYFKEHASKINFKTDDSWVVLSEIEQRIKAKIEAVGTPLKDWDIKIYRGILTGYNEAFIIDGKKREELIAEDPKSAEIIRPILRGRDIKRYSYDFADLWLINTHNGYMDSAGNQIERIDVEDYPAIKNHLDSHWERIEKRYDQGDTPYNLRHCAYMEDFLRPKIIWKRIGSILRFSYDIKGCFALDSTCIATGKDIKYLTAFLNSKIGNYLLQDSPKTGTGDLLVSVQALEPVLIPNIPKELKLIIENMVKTIIQESTEKSIFKIENKINEIIYNVLNLDYNEIQFIEDQ